MTTDEELIALARSLARPRSVTRKVDVASVGCALRAAGGGVFTGVSIDTACGLGFCAEHNAIGAMLSAGEERVATIVAVGKHGLVLPPCGRCRELLCQLDGKGANTRVILGPDRVAMLEELLPDHWLDVATGAVGPA